VGKRSPRSQSFLLRPPQSPNFDSLGFWGFCLGRASVPRVSCLVPNGGQASSLTFYRLTAKTPQSSMRPSPRRGGRIRSTTPPTTPKYRPLSFDPISSLFLKVPGSRRLYRNPIFEAEMWLISGPSGQHVVPRESDPPAPAHVSMS